jgi:hypothetical protein
METVITDFLMSIEENYQAKGKTNGKAKDIDQRVNTVSDEYPDGYY